MIVSFDPDPDPILIPIPIQSIPIKFSTQTNQKGRGRRQFPARALDSFANGNKHCSRDRQLPMARTRLLARGGKRFHFNPTDNHWKVFVKRTKARKHIRVTGSCKTHSQWNQDIRAISYFNCVRWVHDYQVANLTEHSDVALGRLHLEDWEVPPGRLCRLWHQQGTLPLFVRSQVAKQVTI